MDYTVQLEIITKGLEKINSDLSKVTKDVEKQAKDTTKKVEESTKKVSSSTQNLFQQMGSKVNNAMKSATNSIKKLDAAVKALPIAGLITAFTGLTKILGGVNKLFSDGSAALNIENKAMRDMTSSLERNKNMTKDSAKVFADFANQMQSETTFGNEVVMGLVSIASASGGTEDQIKSLIQTAADMSAKTGQDIEQVTKQLTLGMSDAAKAMATAEQAGVGFTAAEKKLINELKKSGQETEAFALVQQKLNAQFGGEAQKEILTYEGKIKQLENVTGDVSEEFGKLAQAISEPFVDAKRAFMEKFYSILQNPQVQDFIQKLVIGFQLLGKAITWVIDNAISILVTAFQTWFNIQKNLIDGINNLIMRVVEITAQIFGFTGTIEELKTAMIQLAQDGIGYLVNGIEQMINAAKAAGELLVKLFSGDFEGVKESAKTIGDSVSNIFNPEVFKARGAEIVNGVKETIDGVKKHWDNGAKDIQVKASETVSGIEDVATGAADGTKEIFTGIATYGKQSMVVTANSVEELEVKMAEATKRMQDDFKKKMAQAVNATSQLFNGAMNTISSLISDASTKQTAKIQEEADKQVAIYEKQIEQIEALQAQLTEEYALKQQELTSIHEAENAKRKESEDTSAAEYLRRLDETKQQALMTNDLLMQDAITKKQEELEKKRQAELKKAAEDKALADKQAAEKKKLEEEQAVREAALAKEKIMLEHQKAMAAWQGEVGVAKAKKASAVADAAVGITTGVANAALGILSGFASGGPVGAAVAAAMAPMLIATSASAGATSISTANSEFESVNAAKPEAPKFQFGTAGYQMSKGDMAIVGEAGPEVITATDNGRLSVQSTASTASKGTSSGNVFNIVINTNEMNSDTILNAVYDAMGSMRATEIINKD